MKYRITLNSINVTQPERKMAIKQNTICSMAERPVLARAGGVFTFTPESSLPLHFLLGGR